MRKSPAYRSPWPPAPAGRILRKTRETRTGGHRPPTQAGRLVGRSQDSAANRPVLHYACAHAMPRWTSRCGQRSPTGSVHALRRARLHTPSTEHRCSSVVRWYSRTDNTHRSAGPTPATALPVRPGYAAGTQHPPPAGSHECAPAARQSARRSPAAKNPRRSGSIARVAPLVPTPCACSAPGRRGGIAASDRSKCRGRSRRWDRHTQAGNSCSHETAPAAGRAGHAPWPDYSGVDRHRSPLRYAKNDRASTMPRPKPVRDSVAAAAGVAHAGTATTRSAAVRPSAPPVPAYNVQRRSAGAGSTRWPE
ncbi:hypothetical protein KOJCDNHJ_00643 [Xanthomonas citri pv. punicae]|nr:hypothetical protein KOJCDNHJ_00643 [Xanthomonas citri pv. punicae]